jgi:hypothetical protein
MRPNCQCLRVTVGTLFIFLFRNSDLSDMSGSQVTGIRPQSGLSRDFQDIAETRMDTGVFDLSCQSVPIVTCARERKGGSEEYHYIYCGYYACETGFLPLLHKSPTRASDSWDALPSNMVLKCSLTRASDSWDAQTLTGDRPPQTAWVPVMGAIESMQYIP